MRLVVGPETYDIQEVLQTARLGDLKGLKRRTKISGFAGVTVNTIKASFVQLGEKMIAEQEAGRIYDLDDILDDDAFLENMVGLIYLAKRGAGERTFTYEDAEAVPLDEFGFHPDPEDQDEEDEAAPKAPASDPDASPEQL